MARSLCWGVHVQPYQLKLMEVSGTCIYVLISMETRKNKKIDCAMQNYHTSNILEKCATKVITTKHLSFWNKIVSYIVKSDMQQVANMFVLSYPHCSSLALNSL
jgi:hypothetical protein